MILLNTGSDHIFVDAATILPITINLDACAQRAFYPNQREFSRTRYATFQLVHRLCGVSAYAASGVPLPYPGFAPDAEVAVVRPAYSIGLSDRHCVVEIR